MHCQLIHLFLHHTLEERIWLQTFLGGLKHLSPKTCQQEATTRGAPLDVACCTLRHLFWILQSRVPMSRSSECPWFIIIKMLNNTLPASIPPRKHLAPSPSTSAEKQAPTSWEKWTAHLRVSTARKWVTSHTLLTLGQIGAVPPHTKFSSRITPLLLVRFSSPWINQTFSKDLFSKS